MCPAARAISRRSHASFLHPRPRGRGGIPARTITRRGCRKESWRAHRVSLSAMSIRSPRCAPLLALLVVAGCGSSGSPSDAGDAAIEVPELCGDAAACSTDQLCVSEQNCTAMVCTPVADGGSCPAGTSATPSCPDGGPPGCLGGCSVLVRVRGAARRLRDAQLRVRDRALFARDVSRDDGRPRRLRRALAVDVEAEQDAPGEALARAVGQRVVAAGLHVAEQALERRRSVEARRRPRPPAPSRRCG